MHSDVPVAKRHLDTEEPVYTIVRVIAEIKGIDPLELTPLYHEIPIDMVTNAPFGEGDWELNFTYESYSLTIDSRGFLIVDDEEPPTSCVKIGHV